MTGLALPRSLRLLARSRRFTALAIVALGVAIALNTTMYSVIDALVFPKRSMHDVAHLYGFAYYGDFTQRVPQEDRNRDIAALPIVEGAAGSQTYFADTRIAERGRLMRAVIVTRVTPTYFAVVQGPASRGRLLGPSDLDAPSVPVVVSDRLWNGLFPDRDWFEGATFTLDGEPRTVVGTLAREADLGGFYTDVWQLYSPKDLAAAPITVVRVRPNVGFNEVGNMFAMLGRKWAARAGLRWDETAFRMFPAVGEPFRYRRFHVALVGAVAALLLLACVNLANLQLARGVSRARELATRSAIGASRRDLIAQLVAESAWIAIGGLVLGVLLTFWGMHVVRATLPVTLEDTIARPYVSWRVFAFATAAAAACLACVGLFPALKLSRVDIGEVMKSGAGTGTARRAGRQYGAFMAAQVALALPLVVSAALMMRTALLTLAIDTTRYRRLVVGWLAAQVPAADSLAARHGAQQVLERVRAIPGIVDAGYEAQAHPVDRRIAVDDQGGAPHDITTGLWSYSIVSPSLLRAVGLGVRKGRDFSEGEFAEPVAIINDRTAQFLFPGADPIGRLIKLGSVESRAPWVKVIGVLAAPPPAPYRLSDRFETERLTPGMGQMYVLAAGNIGTGAALGWYQLYVRGSGDVGRVPLLVGRALAPMRPNVRIIRISTLEQWMGITSERERNTFVATLFVTFAALALAVALMGVYGVVAHAVSQREREFAVRKALGADDRDIRGHVLGYGRVACLLGVAIGLAITAKTVQLLMAFLSSEADVNDSALFGGVALALFAATVLATYIPARRAMKLDPVAALRHE